MAMYNPNIESKYFNISIDGLDLIGSDFSPSESFNHRETARHGIIGGTQNVILTTYVPRDFTFQTKVHIDPLYPDVYDSTFQLWMSKPVEVVSKELGGLFKAECKVKKTHESPAYLSLEIQLIEIPDETSNIPNDTFKAPSVKVITTSKKNSKKNKKNKKSTKTSSKNKNKKNKKSGKNSKKKKGGKITKTK